MNSGLLASCIGLAIYWVTFSFECLCFVHGCANTQSTQVLQPCRCVAPLQHFTTMLLLEIHPFHFIPQAMRQPLPCPLPSGLTGVAALDAVIAQGDKLSSNVCRVYEYQTMQRSSVSDVMDRYDNPVEPCCSRSELVLLGTT